MRIKKRRRNLIGRLGRSCLHLHLPGPLLFQVPGIRIFNPDHPRVKGLKRSWDRERQRENERQLAQLNRSSYRTDWQYATRGYEEKATRILNIMIEDLRTNALPSDLRFLLADRLEKFQNNPLWFFVPRTDLLETPRMGPKEQWPWDEEHVKTVRAVTLEVRNKRPRWTPTQI